MVLRYQVQEPGKADEAADGYARWYLSRLKLLDQALDDDRQFLCSGRFTLADVCIAWTLFLGDGVGLTF